MSAVFLDTVGLLALWDVRDQWHAAAKSAFEALRDEGAAVCTTTLILAECANATARTSARANVVRFGNAMKAGCALHVPGDDEWREAWENFAGGFVGGPGLVDELSFVVMRRLDVRRAFTNDRHFRDAGFETLF